MASTIKYLIEKQPIFLKKIGYKIIPFKYRYGKIYNNFLNNCAVSLTLTLKYIMVKISQHTSIQIFYDRINDNQYLAFDLFIYSAANILKKVYQNIKFIYHYQYLYNFYLIFNFIYYFN